MKTYKITAIVKMEDSKIGTGVFDTIRSIERQTVSFRQNVRVLLLIKNDDPLTGIEPLYHELYPDNFKVVRCDSVSDRLRKVLSGIFSGGGYVCIVNAGDVFSTDTFSTVYDYFENNKGTIDVVGIKIRGNAGYKSYNENFKKDAQQNIHLSSDYKKHPQDLNGLFIKANVAREKAREQENGFSEKRFLADVMCRRKHIGYVKDTAYLATVGKQKQTFSMEEFADQIKIWKSVVKDCKRKNQYLPYFVQRLILIDMMSLLDQTEDLMGHYEHPDYDFRTEWNCFQELLSDMDDRIIMESSTARFKKLFLLHIKYRRNCEFDLFYRDARIMYGNTAAYLMSSLIARIELVDIKDGVLSVEGHFQVPAGIDMSVYKILALADDTFVDVKQVERYSDRYYYDRVYLYEKGFHLELPMESYGNGCEIFLAEAIGKVICVRKKVEYMALSAVGTELAEGYFYKDGYVITANKNSICCHTCGVEERGMREEQLQKEISGKLPGADEVIALRAHYWENIDRKEKQIWLLMDRPDRADDNAEAFFQYMMNEKDDRVDCYFVLSSKSPHYERVSKIGRVVEPFSTEHRKLHLLADYVISSQMAEATINPFNETRFCLRDLMYGVKLVFLQHGVIHNDHGKTLGRFGRNFYGFITSASKEYHYILSPKFHYSKKEVWLTGMPRFDRLYSSSGRKITVMPTWRKYLTTRTYSEEE